MKLFKKQFSSLMTSTHSDILMDTPPLDENLEDCLKELKLSDYSKNFARARIVYEDLPTLSEEELIELVKDRFPRGRLKKYIKKTFGKKSQNGWEIDPKNVIMDKDADVVKTGSYGKIKLGNFKVGIADIRIAVKEIKIDGVTTTKDTVIDEVLAMAALRHRNVLKCFGCWFEGQTAFIALEFCSQGDLYGYMKKHPLSKLQKLQFLYQIGEGIKYMHSRGMVHRDLKPQNILVGDDEKTVKICDFGTSKLASKVEGTLCGTPAYLSSETFNPDEEESTKPEKTDIYAFGIIIWEIWTNKIPYANLQRKFRKDTFKFLQAIHGDGDGNISRPNVDDEELNDCPEDLIDLMQGCWEKSPEERPPSFNFICDELEYYIQDHQKQLKKKDNSGDSDDDFTF